ncbi:sensor histidine kinase [Kocuria flava]|uniref:sensor histidine kinase n=1 Tax=Kocuria flava TaxID=446860 RepID=UPI0021516E88|nr:HAMP domain-containing sensor histidine kinase [Kocuria flava]
MRLSTRLIAGVLVLMAVVLLVLGATIVELTRQDLADRLDGSLRQATGRALTFTRGDSVLERDPLDAPGQPVGVLVAVMLEGDVVTASYRTDSGEPAPLPEEDVAELQEAGAFEAESPDERGFGDRRRSTGTEQGRLSDVVLSVGEYRVESVARNPQGLDRVLVVGLPTATVDDTVAELVTTMTVGSLVALLTVAVAGTVVVRRALRPLEQVSAAASRVARLPLASGEVSLADQHMPAELAVPGTEVGEVGHALNSLLDNVDSALAARQHSETRLREFVADASHELRTPLAAVRGYTDMLRLTEPLTDTGRASLTRVEQQTLRMTALVEDLLLLARLDEGRPLQLRDADLGELVLEALTDASAAGPDHDWALDVPEEPVPVRADVAQLHQVLANLLSNARKHTPPGTAVTAAVRTTPDGWAEASVLDEGPGIPREFQARLFERFSRLDTSRASREGSTGLGLSIVRSVVQAHGGTVDVESRPGRTLFTFRLPLRTT